MVLAKKESVGGIPSAWFVALIVVAAVLNAAPAAALPFPVLVFLMTDTTASGRSCS